MTGVWGVGEGKAGWWVGEGKGDWWVGEEKGALEGTGLGEFEKLSREKRHLNFVFLLLGWRSS